MPQGSDLLAAALFAVGFLVLVGAAELWRRLGSPEPEWTRKLVHLGGRREHGAGVNGIRSSPA